MKRDEVENVVYETLWMDFPYTGQTSAERVAGKITNQLFSRFPELFDGPKARRTDPHTSHNAAILIKAKAGTARVRLLQAFSDASDMEFGITDEEAALLADVSLMSEYATRCSELRAMGAIEFTGNVRLSMSGLDRGTSRLTDLGRSVLLARRLRSDR